VSVTVPSGEQFEIAYGEQRATIVEVGGGIREYSAGGRDVLDPYPLTAICDGAHGAPLVPWPNRLADGRYRFDGIEHQVALTEPQRHNAIHGFLRWRPWSALDREANAVAVGTRLYPLPGYPFALDVQVAYRLDDAGLSVETAARNIGETACPYACGQHPYLSAGSGVIDDFMLVLPARTRILTDSDRKLPCGAEPVDGTEFDFRAGRRLGDREIDSAFTDLERDADGYAYVRLLAADGAGAELWVDRGYQVIEIYTGDDLAPERRRRGLAVEPMTCPPNALQTGDSLIRLQPGERVTTRWGVRPI
jgi:aldose 1-epimerase